MATTTNVTSIEAVITTTKEAVITTTMEADITTAATLIPTQNTTEETIPEIEVTTEVEVQIIKTTRKPDSVELIPHRTIVYYTRTLTKTYQNQCTKLQCYQQN